MRCSCKARPLALRCVEPLLHGMLLCSQSASRWVAHARRQRLCNSFSAMRRSRSSLHEQSLDSLRGHIRQKTGADDGLKELLAQQHDTWRTQWQTGQQGAPSRLHRAARWACGSRPCDICSAERALMCTTLAM